MKCPRQAHWDAAIRVVRYLKGSLVKEISSLPLVIFRSLPTATQLAIMSFHSTLPQQLRYLTWRSISWKTKKQDCVARSSTVAEYRAMAFATQEILWIKELLQSIGIPHKSPMKLVCDSKSALHIAANLVFHERT
ncbi:unnamed protein product [Microthlaspi erraticum]|uniref:Reverse transcriptase Ty1/copia-type domain-containing protein n=1 Tax=Microthlaspi erraticum TaxID=1685480 RepID=A0A6D2JZE8_9BRAS|nr:unnamed protein product [Microthlaspi erraticum]